MDESRAIRATALLISLHLFGDLLAYDSSGAYWLYLCARTPNRTAVERQSEAFKSLRDSTRR